ncbi:MAG: hypothetical protein MSJ26_03745 [Oscillospiraceae bacterium]|nr:hypothetical protein [Oscillospiraceae bacterium]
MTETAINILKYMKTPRNSLDFTVQDHKNLSEKQKMSFAEVKFKGRLCGKYSSELGEDEYIYVRISG